MSVLLTASLAALVLATSFLSGIFGMAGGLILLGGLLLVFDVATAQTLFGMTQLSSNSWRAFLWRAHVRWDLVWRYGVGSLITFGAMRIFAFLPDKAWMYVGLGLSAFVVRVLPKRLDPDVERPYAAQICGASIMAMQLLAGAAGPTLDIFFQRSSLDRKTIVATKAATQTLAHLLRVLYVGSLVGDAFTLPLWVYPAAMAIAMLGGTLAARVLNAMSDAGFKRWSWRLILTVSLSYLARGVWMLAAGA